MMIGNLVIGFDKIISNISLEVKHINEEKCQKRLIPAFFIDNNNYCNYSYSKLG